MENKGEIYSDKHFYKKNKAIYFLISLLIVFFIIITILNNELIGLFHVIFIVFGLTVDNSIENNYKKEDNVRELSESEQIDRIISMATMFAIIIIGLYIFLLLLFLNNL